MLSHFFCNLLSPPQYPDEEQTRVASQIRHILLLGIVINFVLTLIIIASSYDHIFSSPNERSIWEPIITSSLCITFILLFWLLKRRKLQLVIILLIVIPFIGIATSSILHEGIRDPGIYALLLLMTLASFFLGSRATTLFGLVSVILVIGLFFAERAGLISSSYSNEPPTYIHLLVTLLTMSLMTILLRLTVKRLIEHSEKLGLTAEALLQKNQQLEVAQIALYNEMEERQQAETALRHKQKLESVGLLAGGVAHDFNNLLTGMLGQSSIALRKLGPDHDASRHIKRMIESAERSADLIRQLLAYAGKANLMVEALDLNQILNENRHLLETLIQNRATLHIALEEGLPTIDADRGQIQQLIMNLVLNASEAILHDHGEIWVSTYTQRIEASHRKPWDAYLFIGDAPEVGNYVCLRVADNGSGISDEHRARICDPFFTTKELGHGLGLPAVLGAVRAQKGALALESQLDHGSQFHIYLHVGTKTPAQPVVQNHVAKKPQAELILIIDDEEQIREIAHIILTEAGYHTLHAENGEQGIALFRRHHAEVFVVLIDIQMQGINGFETYRELHKINPQLKAIFSSGYHVEKLPADLPDNTATHFLPKPYTESALLRKVAEFI